MALATLTGKGQVTIPKVIRDSLQLQAGDKGVRSCRRGRGAFSIRHQMKALRYPCGDRYGRQLVFRYSFWWGWRTRLTKPRRRKPAKGKAQVLEEKASALGSKKPPHSGRDHH